MQVSKGCGGEMREFMAKKFLLKGADMTDVKKVPPLTLLLPAQPMPSLTDMQHRVCMLSLDQNHRKACPFVSPRKCSSTRHIRTTTVVVLGYRCASGDSSECLGSHPQSWQCTMCHVPPALRRCASTRKTWAIKDKAGLLSVCRSCKISCDAFLV